MAYSVAARNERNRGDAWTQLRVVGVSEKTALDVSKRLPGKTAKKLAEEIAAAVRNEIARKGLREE